MGRNDLARMMLPPRQYVQKKQTYQMITPDLWLTGQINPEYEQEQLYQHGRTLSGFGDPDMRDPYLQPSEEPDYTYRDELQALELQDDSAGSGIFDDHARAGTANVDDGIFASHYSLPGNVAREVPFAISDEVIGLPSGAAIVHVPGGGMAYVEQHGHMQEPRPAGGGLLQNYVQVEEPYLKAHQRRELARNLRGPARDASSAPVMPGQPHQSPYYLEPDALYHRPESPSAPVAFSPAPSGVPLYPRMRQVPGVQTVDPAVWPLRIGGPRALGQAEPASSASSDSGPGWVTFGIVGVILGAVGAMFFSPGRE